MALIALQQVKIWKTGQLFRHDIAEISLSVTLNHNQRTNKTTKKVLVNKHKEKFWVEKKLITKRM